MKGLSFQFLLALFTLLNFISCVFLLLVSDVLSS